MQCILATSSLAPHIENCTDSDILAAESDGYRWHKGRDPIISALYREWWFFAAYDAAQDVAICFGYSVSDPAKTFKQQSSGIAGMLWPSVMNNNTTKMVPFLDAYQFEDFSATAQNATVRITQLNTIDLLDAQNYQIRGATRDGTIRWWLQFEQQRYACREAVDVPELLQLDWISYMPAAKVSGIVQYMGKNITISTVGYHDHNYGAWPTNL